MDSFTVLPSEITSLAGVEDKLNVFYNHAKKVFLSLQDKRTGLLPLLHHVLPNAHGDGLTAGVRDNVYCAMFLWSLSKAYHKAPGEASNPRAEELRGAVLKIMRGLLKSMMLQVDRVERFKVSQSPKDSLHSLYNRRDFGVLMNDDYSHLQLDATSLFVLQLAQMTEGGLQIVTSHDEVDFVQNLVYYIEMTFETPDFGIWARGDKSNHGHAELNASSVGMAKAALEAISRVNLMGKNGATRTVVHTFDDIIARNHLMLTALLPKESASKEVDGALLGVIGFPAFAVDDAELIRRTRKGVVDKLQGRFGCKRFLLDGYQTVVEDKTRLHYESNELKSFENIECQYPLFFTFLYIDALQRGDKEKAAEYKTRIEGVVVEKHGKRYMPQLYYVPRDRVEEERKNPNSQELVPNEWVLLWAQSLWCIGLMLDEKLIDFDDLDPIRRRECGRNTSPVIQVALLSESEFVKIKLERAGVPSQLPSEIEGVCEVRRASELNQAYTLLGKNKRLNLTGRPTKEFGTLVTSQFFKVQRGRSSAFDTIMLLPQFMDQKEFYLSFDYSLLVDSVRERLSYLGKYWRKNHSPTLALMLTQQMFHSKASSGALFSLLNEIVSGEVDGISVKVGPASDLLQSGEVEYLDFVNKDEEREAERYFGFTRPPIRELSLKSYLSAVRFDPAPSPSPSPAPSPMPSPMPSPLPSPATSPSSSPMMSRLRGSAPLISLDPSEVDNEDGSTMPEQHQEENQRLLKFAKKLSLRKKQSLANKTTEQLVIKFRGSSNLYEGIEILGIIASRLGLDHTLEFDSEHTGAKISDLVEEMFTKAGSLELWGVVRHAAAIAQKVPYALHTVVSDILNCGKDVLIGRGEDAYVINKAQSSEKIHELCMQHSEDIRMGLLLMELLEYLGAYARYEPHLFEGLLCVRVYYIATVFINEIKRQRSRHMSTEDAFDLLIEKSPIELKKMVQQLLRMDEEYQDFSNKWFSKTLAQVFEGKDARAIINTEVPWSPKSDGERWTVWRQTEGSLSRVPKDFYDKVYTVLEHCKGIQVCNRRLDANVTNDVTRGERKFAMQVEAVMGAVRRPGMRQLIVEALYTIAHFIEGRKQFFHIIINVSGVIETAVEALIPSFFNDVRESFFAYLDDAEIEDEDYHMLFDGASPKLPSTGTSGSEQAKDRLRRRVFAAPPLEVSLLTVQAFVSFYGLII